MSAGALGGAGRGTGEPGEAAAGLESGGRRAEGKGGEGEEGREGGSESRHLKKIITKINATERDA